MSAVETTWHLATSSASTLPTIFVSVGSKVMDLTLEVEKVKDKCFQVMEAGTGRELDSSPALLNSINTASKIALNRFGHLNTVTTVTGEANRVFVQVPQNLGDQPAAACLGQTRAKSLAVKAYMVIILLSIMVVIICVICVIISVIICVIRWSVSPHMVATTRKQPACCQMMCM